MAEGLIAGGVLPVIKHIPGHGRAPADSHFDLPKVQASIETLRAVDFPPFEALSDMPMAMTAHVVYGAIDKTKPATTSKKAIRLIRDELGFTGLIMCDDLSMKALAGSLASRTTAALKAGCDVVLHCNGVMGDMVEIAAATPQLKGRAERRAQTAMARLARRVEPLEEEEARARFASAFEGQGATGLDPTERLTTS